MILILIRINRSVYNIMHVPEIIIDIKERIHISQKNQCM